MSLLSFMHYVCCIKFVHFCEERSEHVSNSLAHSLFVLTLCWTCSSNYVGLLRARKSALSGLAHNRCTQLFHLYIPMTTHSFWWWTGLLMGRKPSFPAASSASFTRIARRLSGSNSNLRVNDGNNCHKPKGVLCFLFGFLWLLGQDDHRWSREEVTRKSAMVKYPQRVSANRIRAIKNTGYPASSGQIPSCCNNLLRAEDVKNLLMPRWENCMHGGFKPNLSTLRLFTKRKEGWQGLTSSLCLAWVNIKYIPFNLQGICECYNLKKGFISSSLILISQYFHVHLRSIYNFTIQCWGYYI